jgi:hypothetical protein
MRLNDEQTMLQTICYKLYVTNYMLQTICYKLYVTNYMLQTICYKPESILFKIK